MDDTRDINAHKILFKRIFSFKMSLNINKTNDLYVNFKRSHILH